MRRWRACHTLLCAAGGTASRSRVTSCICQHHGKLSLSLAAQSTGVVRDGKGRRDGRLCQSRGWPVLDVACGGAVGVQTVPTPAPAACRYEHCDTARHVRSDVKESSRQSIGASWDGVPGRSGRCVFHSCLTHGSLGQGPAFAALVISAGLLYVTARVKWVASGRRMISPTSRPMSWVVASSAVVVVMSMVRDAVVHTKCEVLRLGCSMMRHRPYPLCCAPACVELL